MKVFTNNGETNLWFGCLVSGLGFIVDCVSMCVSVYVCVCGGGLRYSITLSHTSGKGVHGNRARSV